jgi:1-acyl-sn-glycerol-3-phosphate acyltransferase
MTKGEAPYRITRAAVRGVLPLIAPWRGYGTERIPREGGLVVAMNHFSWLDPLVFGASCPRTIYYIAKVEATSAPGIGWLIRSLGAFPIRRGESDRVAVRYMRSAAAEGKALGLFVEGTRQSSVPGDAQPGAAMVALHEHVPVLPAAIHGSQHWRLGNFRPVSVAWGEPIRFDGLPPNSKGYREASSEIQREIRRLWEFLVEMHEVGRPATATPP